MPNIADLIHHYGYLALFLGSMLEGETVTILGGIAAHRQWLDLVWAIVAAAAGGALGDILLFLVGHRYGVRAIQRFGGNKTAHIERMQASIHRHQYLAIFGVRFLYGLRLIGPVVIGASHVRIATFVLFNLLGAIVWATLLVGGGYLFGSVFTHYLGNIERHLLWLIPLLIVVALLVRWWLKRRHDQQHSGD
ncbi:DedA family protein [Carnimonas bestiolae]|uniref:DedA family protein n=1 Tax=Carnimonas bestiolae TaxID=3402172 RepID=UPI003EDB7769